MQMSIPIYSECNPRVTEKIVHSRWTKMTFGEEIKKRLAEKGMRPAELARRAQTTRQNISRLINGTPHPITGALPKAELETVERIAKALDWDLPDARNAAGYARHPAGDLFRLGDDLDRWNDLNDAQKQAVRELAQVAIKAILDIKEQPKGIPFKKARMVRDDEEKRKTG